MDLRPYLEDSTYPIYIDGRGWINEGFRDHFYCPVCNPKNFDEWEKMLRAQRELKNSNNALLEAEQERRTRDHHEDRCRAAAVCDICIDFNS